MPRVNAVGFKGECRKCISCGDVKIWDYPNERKCPNGKRHKWRPIASDDLTGEENDSIDRQVKWDEQNVKHKPQIIINNEEDAKRVLGAGCVLGKKSGEKI